MHTFTDKVTALRVASILVTSATKNLIYRKEEKQKKLVAHGMRVIICVCVPFFLLPLSTAFACTSQWDFPAIFLV